MKHTGHFFTLAIGLIASSICEVHSQNSYEQNFILPTRMERNQPFDSLRDPNPQKEPIYTVPPSLWTLGLGLGTYLNVSFPNIHLRSGIKMISKGRRFTIPIHETKGVYLGLYVTGGSRNRFGLKSFYLFRPFDKKFNFYPMIQVGFRYIELDDDIGNPIELRLGGGVFYSPFRNNWVKLFAEIGTGVTPIFVGATFPFLKRE